MSLFVSICAEEVTMKTNRRTGNVVLTFSEKVSKEDAADIVSHLPSHLSGAVIVGVHDKYLVVTGGPWGEDAFQLHLQKVFSEAFWPIDVIDAHHLQAA